MKFEIGVLPPDHPDVIAARHSMRTAAPSAAATAKVGLGYGQTFSDGVRGDLSIHPGFVEHCARSRVHARWPRAARWRDCSR
jgi:hypothetical protein